MDGLTELLARVKAGDLGARDCLFERAYPDLRRLARSRLRDGGRNTLLDTTALLHESYLRFDQAGDLRPPDARAFFAYAARVMRSVIIDAVRERRTERRGGGLAALTLDTQDLHAASEDGAEVLQVHEALLSLAAFEPRLAQVVEMRYFGGYSDQETAAALDINERTVRRDWEKARLILLALMKD